MSILGVNLNTKEVFALLVFVVLFPGVAFFALRRSKARLRIGFSVLVLILGLLALPTFMRPRMHVAMSACVNNLRWIQDAKLQWAESNHKVPTDVPTMSELFNPTNSVGLQKAPVCPSGGTYTLGAVNEEPRCSIGPPRHTLHPPHVFSDSERVTIQD